MATNIDRYKEDLQALIERGNGLEIALEYQYFPEQIEAALEVSKEKLKALKAKLPSFDKEYQNWYSEAQAVVKQLLPDRLQDFTKLYEKPKSRKEITYENYTIEDGLQGLQITKGYDKTEIVGPKATIPQFRRQLSILKSVEKKFESSLFEIKQLVQADLFDSELDAAKELMKSGFGRAAGAMAGVVLEKHLAQVCASHGITISKKSPHISDLNDLLKNNTAIDVPQWRFIQRLGDLRNLCDHNKKEEPTEEQVSDLIEGVSKITKTVF